jgi:hypothetical protein
MAGFRKTGFTSLSAAVFGLALLTADLGSAPAAAQGYSDRPQMTAEQACQNDAYRFCERFIPDRNTTGACLRRNKRLLSPDCRAFFTTRKLRRR